MTAKEHNKLVGIFLMAHGALQALIMIFMIFIYGIVGSSLFVSARRQEEQIVGLVFIGVIIFVFLFAVVLTVPQLLGGWKLLKEKSGARTWGIIGSIVALLNFPLGTAAGVYGLWFLFGEEGKRFYLGGNSYSQNSFPPPPPNNWQ